MTHSLTHTNCVSINSLNIHRMQTEFLVLKTWEWGMMEKSFPHVVDVMFCAWRLLMGYSSSSSCQCYASLPSDFMPEDMKLRKVTWWIFLWCWNKQQNGDWNGASARIKTFMLLGVFLLSHLLSLFFLPRLSFPRFLTRPIAVMDQDGFRRKPRGLKFRVNQACSGFLGEGSDRASHSEAGRRVASKGLFPRITMWWCQAEWIKRQV